MAYPRRRVAIAPAAVYDSNIARVNITHVPTSKFYPPRRTRPPDFSNTALDDAARTVFVDETWGKSNNSRHAA
jgi:hypothetical protein